MLSIADGDIEAWVQKKAKETGLFVELYISRGQSNGFAYRKGSLYDVSRASDLSFGARLIDARGREGLGYACQGTLTADILEETFRRARSTLEFSPADPYRMAPLNLDSLNPKAPDLNLTDEALRDGLDASKPRQFLEDLQACLLRQKKIREVLRAGISWGWEETAIISSWRAPCRESGTSVSAGVSLIAEDSSGIQTYGGGMSARGLAAVLKGMPDIADKAARVASSLLGAKSIKSGACAVVMDPWVAEEVLSLLADTFCADSVQRGKSPWAGKLGELIASPLVTIVDNGRLKAGMASSLWDDEAWPTGETKILERGRLNHFLYDSYTARRDGTRSTGNASRSFKSSPSPTPTNLYIEAGTKKPQDIIKETGRGFYLVDLMGLHTVDAMSGDFSLGASGFLIEGGELSSPVEKVTVAGNIHEMLKRIDAVGNDLKFHGSVASPTIRVESLQIGGS